MLSEGVSTDNLNISISKHKTPVKISVEYGARAGLSIFVENTSDEVVEFVWDKCSINADNCFRVGKKFVDAERSQPNLIIAPHQTARFPITGASNVYYDEIFQTWTYRPMMYPIKLVLPVKQDNQKEEYIIIAVSKK